MHVVSSPARYMKKQIRPGGIKSSIFSLIILCLGAGTLSIPYVFYTNGLVFGTVLLLLGGLLSIYTGWLVVLCCDKLNATRYEDIAMATYGKKASVITSACMLACLIGFVVSYIVLVSLLSFIITISSRSFFPTLWELYSKTCQISSVESL
jgi:amino acid permease